jgi:hypothetical protein
MCYTVKVCNQYNRLHTLFSLFSFFSLNYNMPSFHQIVDFFRSHQSTNKKAKTNIVPIKKKEPVETSSPPTTTSTQPKTPSYYSQLPELEFEQSRHLLELDFFNNIDNEPNQSSLITTFPQFEHLLNPPPPLPEQQTKKTPNRKLTKTLKHRISVYRPHTKTVKRSLSSPQLCNS